jgi:hypothetical protein
MNTTEIENIIQIAMKISRNKYPSAYNILRYDPTDICPKIVKTLYETAYNHPKATTLTKEQIDIAIAERLIYEVLSILITNKKGN